MKIDIRHDGENSLGKYRGVTVLAEASTVLKIDGRRVDFMHLDWTDTADGGVNFQGTAATHEGEITLTGRTDLPNWLMTIIEETKPAWA